VLQEYLGCTINTFAYPIGQPEHINEEVVKAVGDSGFTWAVTTSSGVNTPESEPLVLRRVLADVSRHRLVMAAEMSGVWGYLAPTWKAIIGK
jgi:hypothetical protein